MDPQWSSFNQKEFSVACPLSSRSLLENASLDQCSWVTACGVKAGLSPPIGTDEHISRRLAEHGSETEARTMNHHTSRLRGAPDLQVVEGDFEV